MASYHRVLAVFGRSVHDKALECDCDIHPWQIKINNEQWPGKIRLIGFVDVFFLISYSANARFEKGIIVYKEKYDIEQLLRKVEEARPDSEPVCPGEESTTMYQEGEKEGVRIGETEISSDNDKVNVLHFDNGTSYTVRSWGYEIGLKNRYPISSVQRWVIEIGKPEHRSMRRRIKRAIKEHTTTELVEDVIRCGFIAQGQLAGHFLSKYLVGGVLDDTMTKYLEGLVSGDRPGRMTLANEGF
ncbi:uncharacterized protein BO80DRAFT_497122 [Aspergillus ibericus CBS 121593]|uniref:Uncharacterized protein n=1 Tax=Aspergillus ibericus CBS 121593 TaxID=1448316 RepID=A0A395GLJ2_9EURO|nr:hypothetical protein BO80DRAFT_497122 [Aspergillus ibericus CBS 121593]RAK96222.1 hypothetical protein BO80DRAFT_497122 [Aspergillus ibericus CBS 121593]